MQRLLAFFVLISFTVIPVATPLVFAQGGWGVERDPFDRKIIARYKRILQRNPNDAIARRKLVNLYKRYRSVALLIREYERTVAKKPKNFSAKVVLGHILLSQGAPDKALTQFENAATLKPKSPAVQMALGELHTQSGAIDKAQQAYEQALAGAKSSKTKRPVLRALADLALGKDDMSAAREYYKQYFEVAPKDVQARIDFGDALMRTGNHLDAVEVFAGAEAKLRSDPSRRVEVITRMGTAYEGAGKDDDAIREYERAMSKVGRSYYLRKELTARIIEIHRQREGLLDLVREYESKWPKNRRQHFEWDVLARLYEETGDQEKAIDAYFQATKKGPHELDTQRRLIALLENSGRDDEALKRYEVVIRVAPGEPNFQLKLAERYWRRSMDKKALALLAKMERRFPGDAGVHAAVADLYTRWGKAELALAAYKRLTRIEPNDITHLVNLGEQYFQRNQKKLANAVWKRIISRKTPQNYARLGEVYAEHDLLPQALNMYAKAIQLDKKNPQHYKGRARVHERKRNFNFAIADWEKVLQLTSKKAVDRPARREARRRVVGLLTRARRGKLSRRMRLWNAAFRSNPPDLDAGYYLVEAYLRARDNDNARDVLTRLLSHNPKDIDAMEQLVKVYRSKLEYDNAVALLEKLADLVPSRKRDFYSKIAAIKTNQLRDDEAIEWMNKAVLSSPADPVAHQQLAERYAQMQQFDKAITAYEKTIKLDKRNFRAHFALAQLYKYVNRPKQAAKLYRQVLERASDEELLRQAGREAIALEELTNSLGELEHTLVPLAFRHSHKPVYRRVLVELYRRYVPALVDAWQRQGHDAARAELTRLGTHGLKPLLEALGDDDDPQQQRIAVDVLGYLGNKGAAAPLIRLAQRSPSDDTLPRRRSIGTLRPAGEWKVRVKALIAAGRLGDARLIDEMIELSRHRDKTMREAALFALGRTGDIKALPALLDGLAKHSPSQRTVTCLGIAQIRAVQTNRQALAAIEAVVENRRNSDYARAACAFALGYLDSQSSIPTLLKVVRHGNDDAQRMAAWALGRLGEKRALPALLKAYFSRHPSVRELVAWAIERASAGGAKARELPRLGLDGYMGDRLSYNVNAAIAALPGPLLDAPRLQSSAQTVVVTHESDVVEGIRSALNRHRDMLVRVLEELNDSNAHLNLGALTRGMSELPAQKQQRVQQALTRIANTLAPRIVQLTQHTDADVRKLALSIVAKIDSSESTRALIRGMNDADIYSVWTNAMIGAATHARLYPKRSAALARALETHLSADDWLVRQKAVEMLAAFGRDADVGAVQRALADKQADVRASAATTLGALGQKQSVSALVEATSDSNDSVAVAAMRSLRTIGGKQARQQLQNIARDSSRSALAEIARELLDEIKN